jgi:hypothetical protein
MHALILLLGLLTLVSNEALAWPNNSSLGGNTDHSSIWKQPDYHYHQELPQNSGKDQQETFRKHNYDTYQNGPLPEALREEQLRREREANSESYRGDTGIDKCRSLYGC